MLPEIIAGRYTVVRAIGHGGMGTVWLCRDEVLGREVAVKQVGVLPGESVPDLARALRPGRGGNRHHDVAVARQDLARDRRLACARRRGQHEHQSPTLDLESGHLSP